MRKTLPYFLLALFAFLPSALAGTVTDKITMTPAASPSCTSGKACIYAKSADGFFYVKDANGLELKLSASRHFRPAADCAGLSSPALGDVCYDTVEDAFQVYSGSGWLSIASTAYVNALTAERAFVRTCTLTSAAAITPVNCLANADVPANMKPYVAGWHAKINGATAWATTANCWIQDTSGTSNIFVTTAVAAMTGNTFLVDGTANVTQQAPYSLGTGGTLDLGLEIACDANGTGSNWVVTVFGVIK